MTETMEKNKTDFRTRSRNFTCRAATRPEAKSSIGPIPKCVPLSESSSQNRLRTWSERNPEKANGVSHATPAVNKNAAKVSLETRRCWASCTRTP